MGIFARGSIVIVSYPFSDLSNAKIRPAVVLASVANGDHILCQIPFESNLVVEIGLQSNPGSGLTRKSFARPEKLFTANESILRGTIGSISDRTLKEVADMVTHLVHGHGLNASRPS